MPLGWFGKKKQDASGSGADSGEVKQAAAASGGAGADGPAATAPTAEAAKDKSAAPPADGRDPRKAKRFFEHAQTVADARNYDYALECFINGLKFDPDNMAQHEKLREVALRRKVNGGKAAGFMDKGPVSGKTPVEKMLAAEYAWSKDPVSPQLALHVMEAAHKADLAEVAYWVGQFVLEFNSQQARPSKLTYTKACQIYEAIGAWKEAVEAQRFVVRMSNDDMNALQRLKNLEAEHTLERGGYGGEKGGFLKGVKDIDKQRALEQQDAVAATASQLEENIKRLKREYEENTDDVDRLMKYVREMLKKDEEAAEEEAIKALQEAFDRLAQYRFKKDIGDIRIKQFNRRARALNQEIASAGADTKKLQELSEKKKKFLEERLRFELAEFAERAKNYPTDMGLRYELGRRQFMAGDFDAAITSFQEAQADPKHRAAALRYLGEAFERKGWYDEAIDTFNRGIEVHPYNDDKLALELRYELVKSLESKARRDRSLPTAEEAAKVASQIALTDFNYKDIRQIIDRLRTFITELRKAPN